MRLKIFTVLCIVLTLGHIYCAEAKSLKGNSEVAKSELKFKPYGFIRTLMLYDTRESKSGLENLFYLYPLDQDIQDGKDLNKRTSFSLASIHSRLGLNILGCRYGNMGISGKFEADFYVKSGSVSVLRLRQAYLNIAWDKFSNNTSLNLRVGQAWHPLSVDMPYCFNVEMANPFQPFNRSPQILLDYSIGANLTLSTALIYQMQYLSSGPNGPSQSYIKYSNIPEFYFGVNYHTSSFYAKAGVDVLTIKPNKNLSGKLTTFNPFVFAEYKKGLFAINTKVTYAQAGEHLKLLSYYIPVKNNEYSPMQSIASYVSCQYGGRLKGSLLLGYMVKLGLTKPVQDFTYLLGSSSGYVTSPANLKSLVRIDPAITYSFGHLILGLEYNFTMAQYGAFDLSDYKIVKRGLPSAYMHWVANNRLMGMIKFAF